VFTSQTLGQVFTVTKLKALKVIMKQILCNLNAEIPDNIGCVLHFKSYENKYAIARTTC
jgi:hypothetical protein